ncbi:uncharacterized protein Z520_05187 [Fonsecaea multimorphosa CBS 102226]|uniref:U6 snRNA phosphodiesterase n=1 Tax=Fonsecaea multimorphosa CBS 102226 TaxID=1442371 RepID=A0A0D2INX7_9EURO|nr:uncharacterized protein Z520_05187 [Fonsecaea multimorphosa CBS 102226]KIX98726.1 hypothetical protein Z520_05187 [Fonsecaea multimorphosa CBS 102226]
MVLVDYPDSSSESEDQDTTKKSIKQGGVKRKAEHVEAEGWESSRPKPPPPPLPTSFHSLYATNARSSTTDDPSLHAGRTRQVPHARAGLALEPAPKDSKPNVHSFLHSELGVQLPLHISLSAPLVLKTEQREQFQSCLESKLKQGRIKPFTVQVSGLDWVANHDKTRFFLVLKLMKPGDDELNRLLSICNAAARQFDLPRLYEERCDTPTRNRSQSSRKIMREMTDKSDAFHISIAWTLDEPDNQTRQELIRLVDDKLRASKVGFPLLKLKIGNSVMDHPFATGCDGDK